MATSNEDAGFPRFLELPVELQQTAWRHSMPPYGIYPLECVLTERNEEAEVTNEDGSVSPVIESTWTVLFTPCAPWRRDSTFSYRINRLQALASTCAAARREVKLCFPDILTWTGGNLYNLNFEEDIFYLISPGLGGYTFWARLLRSRYPNLVMDFSLCQLPMLQRIAVSFAEVTGVGMHEMAARFDKDLNEEADGPPSELPTSLSSYLKPGYACFMEILARLSVNLKEFIVEYDGRDGRMHCDPRRFPTRVSSLLNLISEWPPTVHECYGRLDPCRKKCDTGGGGEISYYEDAMVLGSMLDNLAKVFAGRIPEYAKQKLGLDPHYPQLSHLKLSAMLVEDFSNSVA